VTTDLATYLAGFGASVPTCPAPESTTAGDFVTITLAYGLGCSPLIYPSSTLAGSTVSEVDTFARQLELTFDQFSVDDLEFSGTLAADFGWTDDVVSYDGIVDVTAKNGSRISGSMVVQADRATGRITILTAMLTISTDGAPNIDVLLDDITVDAAANGNFRPSAGIAVSTIEGTDEAAGISVVVECTENTPATGTVQVTVGNGAEIAFSLGS
jgi:hypothetical protein